jgi:hypothetical protein
MGYSVSAYKQVRNDYTDFGGDVEYDDVNFFKLYSTFGEAVKRFKELESEGFEKIALEQF